jgi:hypothetical protein
MQQIQATIRNMSWNEATEYGLCNRGLMLDQDSVTYRLTAGTTDSLYVFKGGSVVYVLTLNLNLDYVALDVYLGHEPDPVDSVFLQGSWAIEECLGTRWRSLSASTMANRLMNQFA